jgi:hypothetical protein
VRGGGHINNGRPSFTGSYQKHISVEYRDRKSEYEQQAKELNEAPKPKLTTQSGLATWNRITKLATTFTSTMNDYDVHHILLMIPPNASPFKENVLADRKVKWAASATFGVTQRDIIDKLLSHQLDDLRETYDALESEALKLVPLSRR